MNQDALQIGQLIEDTYRVVRRVGEGGMGEVYEATHARLAGRYAIKLLLRQIARDPTFMARFQREAQITSSLRHPNIVQVVDFRVLPGGAPYFVMEYLDGVDLAAAVQNSGPMPLPRVLSIVNQTASGLAAAHEQGIVHRDLKPANLFLVVLPGSRSELVKIVDFGISKMRAADTQLTRTSTIMGTPQYMSPEQAQGLGDRLDARADQFSLACIAYELIAGNCAFSGDTIPTVLYQLIHVEAPPLAVNGALVPAAVDAVVRRGMAKRPEDRYASVLDFASALDAAVAEAGQRGVAGAVGNSPALDPTVLGTSGLPGKSAAASSDDQDQEDGTVNERKSRRALPLAVGLAVLMAGGVALVFALRSPATAPAPTPAATAKPSAAADEKPLPPAAVETVTVGVEDAPANLTASLDGGGPQPVPIQLVKGSGSHAILFQAPGYRPRTLRVDAGKDVQLVLSMQRSARGKAVAERAEPPAEPPPASAKERFKRSFNAVKKVWLGD